MKRIILAGAVVVLACRLATAQETDSAAADEAAIRGAVESYVAAFNRGDAEVVASYWSEDGRFVTPAGETFQGRKAIQEGFEAFFKENQGTRIEVKIASIRLEKPDGAVEEGTARVVRAGEPAAQTSYVATHVKRAGTWKMKSLREAVAAPSHYEQLKELEWLVGEWVDQDENSSINTVCQWTKNKNFITRSFAVAIADSIELEGTQVIGWDPIQKVIRSWMFDSDGGFAVGLWTREGDRWTIRTLQVLASGEKASSVNILTRVDDDKFTWKSINREVDGEVLPNIDQVTVARKQSDK